MSNRSITRKLNRRKLEAAMMLNRLALIERLAAQPASEQPLAERVGSLLRRNRNSQPIPFNGEPVPDDDTFVSGIEWPDDYGLEPEA